MNDIDERGITIIGLFQVAGTLFLYLTSCFALKMNEKIFQFNSGFPQNSRNVCIFLFIVPFMWLGYTLYDIKTYGKWSKYFILAGLIYPIFLAFWGISLIFWPFIETFPSMN